LYVFSLFVLRNSALLLNCLQPFKPHLNPLNDPCTADVAAQNLPCLVLAVLCPNALRCNLQTGTSLGPPFRSGIGYMFSKDAVKLSSPKEVRRRVTQGEEQEPN
jgi:hypothetical protein